MDSIRADVGMSQATVAAARSAELTAEVEEATLMASAMLGLEQMQMLMLYYQQVADMSVMLADCEAWMPPMPPSELSDLNQFYDDMMVNNATAPRCGDNPPAVEVRDEYRDNYQDVQNQVSNAEGLVDQYGPGEHELDNGDTVNIQPGEGQQSNGQPIYTVTVTCPDGSSQTTVVNGDQSSVTYRNPDGSTESLQENGTGVTRTDTSADGQTQQWRYFLDAQGRPVREYIGPDGQQVTTVANWDGSSETRTGQGPECHHHAPEHPPNCSCACQGGGDRA